MRLQFTDKFGEVICWNLSSAEQSYALVKLDDCTLSEWPINKCLVVEERKTSAQGELAATVPPVGAANTGSFAIAKLLQWADVALKGTLAYDSLSLFIHEQRQASA
jgi:hypothetical protein